MKKLNDYSGDLVPNLKLSDFSSETLAETLKSYGRIYMALDGFWYLSVREHISNEAALAADIQAWEKICKYEMAVITKQLNIHGNDVIALMKAVQMTPWIRNMEFNIGIKNDNHGILTITRCPVLEALEKEGEGREIGSCHIVGTKVCESYASFFNPNITVTALKLPPRNSKDEVACQWEFSLKT